MKPQKTFVRVRGRQTGEVGVMQYRGGLIGEFPSKAAAKRHMKEETRLGGIPAYKFTSY